ncbi:P-type ATPase [Methanooceanicella nereidis]|nr:cation-transporting P-type ATPase [Methanocella sp. CWC-04]
MSIASAIKEYLESKDGVYSAEISSDMKTLVANLMQNTYPWEVEEMAAEIGYAVQEARSPLFSIGGILEPVLLAITAIATIISFAGTSMNLLTGPAAEILGMFIIFICGYPVHKKAISALLDRKISLDILVSVAVISPLFYSYGVMEPVYYASGIIIFVVLSASIFKRSVQDRYEQMDFFLPSVALSVTDGKEAWINAEDINPGDVVTVKSGYRIPVDGTVDDGEGTLVTVIGGDNEKVRKGVRVNAGDILLEGDVTVKAAKKAIDSVLRPAADAFREARKPREFNKGYPKSVERVLLFVSLFGSIFVYFFFNSTVSAVAILLVATPLAMFIAWPVSIVTGKLAASNAGADFSSHGSIERMSLADTVVISGIESLVNKSTVSDVIPVQGYTENDMKSAIAAYGGDENDPLVKAAREYASGVAPSEEYSLKSLAEASRVVQIPADSHKRANALENEGKLVRYALKGREFMGIVAFDLEVSEETKKAVESLGKDKAKAKEVVLISRNPAGLSEVIGRKAGITNIKSRMDDRERLELVKKMVENKKEVVVVSKRGDLTRFAGNSGSVVIGNAMPGFEGLDDARCDSFAVVPGLISLAKKSLKRANEGLNFGFYFNTFAVIAASLGVIDIQIASLMIITSVVVVATNSMRSYFISLK